MDSVSSGVIGLIPQYVIGPIRTKFRMTRNLGRRFEGLESAKERLDGRSKDEREKLKDIKKQKGVDPSKDAERWFRQAHEAVSDANNLRTKYLDWRNTRGACSNWFCFLSRYRLSKEALDLKGRVDKLNEEDPKAGWTAASTSQKGKKLNTISLDGQTSRESLKDEIIERVLDSRYFIVGLHGMGGIGKTTLLQHINNHFINTEHFNSIIFTTLSATPDFEKLREEIAEGFGLDLKDCTGDNDVKKKLSRQTERYLLILDDMWEPPVDLNEICIPSPTNENGCKILMASRSLIVINKFVNQFAGVDSLRAIRVDTLPQHEAWNLFVEKVGESLNTSRPEIKPIAEEIVRRCDGLPLVIMVVASTMSTRQTIGEWKDALREMGQMSKANLEDIKDKVFKLLKFSFEKLNSLEKSLFLYCCIFPEDACVMKYEFYQFGIGEEALCDEMPTLEDMRGKLDVLVGNLKNSSMLEDGRFEGVKMHDVLREFGLWIASPKIIANEAGKVFTSEWSKAGLISLYSVESMPLQLSDDCPHLHTLILSPKESAIMSLPQEHFLEHMPALKILDLDGSSGIKKLPRSISHLVNLRSLCLRGCHSLKELPPEIGMLVQLVSLDLETCESLRRLPVEMKELKNLRHLDIGFTFRLKKITCGLLSGLHKLEEIEALESGLKLDNDNILELYQLPHLTLISEISVWKVNVVSHFLKQLTKWSCRRLEFWDCDIDSSAPLDLLQFLQLSYGMLRFRSCKGLTRVPTHDHITTLVVDRCRDLKTLVVPEKEKVDEMNNIIAFQNLFYLELVELDGLETICSGRVPRQQPLGLGSSCLFSNLRRIRIERCHKLKVLFTSGVTPLLLKLIDLMVLDCSQLEYLLVEDNGNDDMESIINAFPKLSEISLIKLPELTAICTSDNTSNQHPMDLIKCPFLRRAYVYDCPKLKLRRAPLGTARLIEEGAYIMSSIKESDELRKREEEELEDDDTLECID